MILRLEGDEASGWKPAGTPTVFLGGPSTEQQPRFSPDGRWLAYESNESGRFEIYVRPFPGTGRPVADLDGRRHQCRLVGARGRNELLYLAPDGRIMMVPYTVAGDKFQPGKATRLERDARPASAANRGQLRSGPRRRARGDGAASRRDGRPDARDALVQLLR